jgi:hypothetical protein
VRRLSRRSSARSRSPASSTTSTRWARGSPRGSTACAPRTPACSSRTAGSA